MLLSSVKLGVGGRYHLEVTNPKLGTKREIPWFDNLVLNIGLDKIGSGEGAVAALCGVGTDASPPDVNQTGLISPLGARVSADDGDDTNGASPVAPYYCYQRRKFVFPANTIVGNLTEIAVGWGTNNTDTFSRTLIQENGVPVTLTILEDEILTVTYELRIYPDMNIYTKQLVVNAVTYDISYKAAYANDPTYWGSKIGKETLLTQMDNKTGVRYFDGYMGTVFTAPSGNSLTPLDSCPPMIATTYTSGTYYRDFVFNCNAASCNLTNGIKSALWQLGGTWGAFQYEFTPHIPKSLEWTLKLTLRYIWSRYTP